MRFSAMTGQRPKRRRATAIGMASAGVAATLALAACSSSSSTPASSPSSSSAPSSSAPSGSSSPSSSAATSASAVAANPAKPTVLLDWFPNPDHASLYLAQSDGDFTSAGLQGVTLQAPSGSQDALKLVSTGAMPLGISYEPNVVTAASQGLDVEAVAALIPTPLNTLLISSQSGIKTIKGLAGKKIGTNGDPVETATLNTILRRNGVNPSSTQQIAVSEGLIPAMLSGNVQAIISGYRNVEEIQLKLKGQPPVAFNVENEGMPTYDELVIVAQKSKLASDPGYAAMVRDFLAGLAKGDAAAQARSSAAIAALKPVVGAGGYTDADINAMVPVTVADYKNPLGFGEMSTAKWQAYADWMLANKLITKAVTASDAETDAFLPGKG
ncbi:ABC transporter substrate-binding protein [Trebonia kvetii]|uniref:ABC transporter substrate-binding protein n=1 Tax=Trebonia kvetii TaxID=2480626 RepID=A0A6P2BWQ6_9ACTN|nr:ABC transporter substrate-binding protein [Trebonia kvetii]TVZ03569.1 ABC transporter substrate-binding protein [Trebonia kvetii]